MAQKETSMFSDVNISKKKSMWPMLFGVLVVALIATTSGGVYFYLQNVQLKKNPQAIAQQEVKSLIDKVSRLMVLPEGETPTIATVSEPEKLKDQPFFSKAQKGDKVLIYTNAKKAILYSPSTNKIVDVAPINIGNTSAPATPPATPPAEKNP